MARITDTDIAGYLNEGIIVNKDKMLICDGLVSSDNTNMIMKVEMFKDIQAQDKREYVVIYVIFDADHHSLELQNVFDEASSLDFGDVLTLNVWFGHGKDTHSFWVRLAEYLTRHFPSLEGYECSQLNSTDTHIKDIQEFKRSMATPNALFVIPNILLLSTYRTMFHQCPTLLSTPELPDNINASTSCV